MSETNKKSWKDHYWFTIPCMKKRIEKIVELVGSEKEVLECGCNEGFVSKALLEAGNLVTSTDLDPEMIRKAKKIFDLNVIKADVNALPFEDDSFQVVVAGELLEHTTNPGRALTEIFRVAREKVVITIPIGEYWLGELTHFWELNATGISHDTAEEHPMPKDILVLCWDRRRDNTLTDISPFSTQEWKKKYKP